MIIKIINKSLRFNELETVGFANACLIGNSHALDSTDSWPFNGEDGECLEEGLKFKLRRIKGGYSLIFSDLLPNPEVQRPASGGLL